MYLFRNFKFYDFDYFAKSIPKLQLESMKTILILILGFFSISIFAQEGNVAGTLKGKVMDMQGNPIAYTNIGLEGTYFGTASNAEGEFELKIPDAFTSYRIFFSAVGYKNSMLMVSDLLKKEFNIVRLQDQSYSIDDIDVNAQSKVLYRILRTASENIPKNFQAGPFTLKCEYIWEKDANGAKRSRKANLDIYDQNGYNTPTKLDAYEKRNYQLSNVIKNFESYSLTDGSTNIDEIINLDFARMASSILNTDLASTFELNMENEPDFKGVSTWLIGFKQTIPTFEGSGDYYANQFEGKLYINKNNYAVMRIECWVTAPLQNRMGRELAVSQENTNFLTDVKYDFSVEYNANGLEFISINKNYMEKGKPIKETTKLMVNSLERNTDSSITSRDYFEGK